MVKITWLCRGAFAFTAFLTSTASAQKRVTIDDDVACRDCRITFQRVVRIGDLDGPGALGGVNYGVTVDGRGRYWVGGRPPRIFGADGRLLQSAARTGPGPLEIPEYTRPIALPGDSVLLADARGNGIVLAPDLRIARRIRKPRFVVSAIGTLVQWPDLVMFSGSSQFDRRRAGPCTRCHLRAVKLASRSRSATRRSACSAGAHRPSLFETANLDD